MARSPNLHQLMLCLHNGTSGLFLIAPGIKMSHHSNRSHWAMSGTVRRSRHCGHQPGHRSHSCDDLSGKQISPYHKLISYLYLQLNRRRVIPALALGHHTTELLRFNVRLDLTYCYVSYIRKTWFPTACVIGINISMTDPGCICSPMPLMIRMLTSFIRVLIRY